MTQNINSTVTTIRRHGNETSCIPIRKGTCEEQMIAFTYDTGVEDSETCAILDVLNMHRAKCTFFITGVWAESFPSLAKLLVKEGHELGNHSYDHPYISKLSFKEIKKNIKKGEEAIKSITGIDTRPLFRPPFGEWDRNVLNAAGEIGYPYCILWSIDTIDWQHPETNVIINRIISKASKGDIVLMHVDGTHTAEATGIAIKTLKEHGFNFVTVGKMLKL